MTGADDGENARPGELSPRAAAALDRLSTVEAELREQLGPRRAHSAIVVTALLSTRLGADRLGDLAYHATPTDVFRDLDADVERALSAFDAQSVFNELYKTGHLHRTVGDVAAVIRSLSDSDQLMLAGELLKRTADPFVGMFTVPAEIAVLASRLTVGATENGEAHDRLYKRELRVFDPRAGCGEMLLELAHLIENHQGRAWVVGCEPSAEALGIAQASIALAGYSTSDLHQEEWLLRTASHEQAFDYLVSAIPATSWRHLDRWLEYGLSLPARPRSTDSSLLYVAKVAQRVSELPNSRAVLVVNSAALTTGAAGSGDVQLRRMIVELGALRAVIALPSGIFERTTVAPTMLLFTGSMDSRAKSSSSFRLVDARMYGARVDRKRRILGAADVDEIVMAVAQGGSENAVEIDIQVLAEDGRWRIPPFGKRISAKKGHSSSQDSAPTLDEHELGELCRVMSGRNRVAKETDRDPDLRVIRAEDVGVELRPWADLPYSTRRRKSSVEVAPGDIVGSISRPYGRWVLVPDGYGRALASDHTVVLRKQRDVSMWYILSFLRSERGKRWIESTFRGTVPRIARDELALIPVPDCPIESIEIDMILRDYESELIRLESEVGQLRSRLSAIHDTESPVETAANVDSLYGIVASVRSVGSL